jgi:Na+/glutamate symporter
VSIERKAVPDIVIAVVAFIIAARIISFLSFDRGFPFELIDVWQVPNPGLFLIVIVAAVALSSLRNLTTANTRMRMLLSIAFFIFAAYALLLTWKFGEQMWFAGIFDRHSF